MDQVTRVLDAVLDGLIWFGAVCVGYGRVAEGFLRARMTELGWSANVQTALLVVVTVLVVLVLLRVFAPVLRVVLVLFLLVLALQFFHPEQWRRGHAALACSPLYPPSCAPLG